MSNSRLERVRNKRAGKQGLFYLVVAIVLMVGMIGWGLPLAANLAGTLIKPDQDPRVSEELRPAPPIFSDVPEATYSGKVAVSGFAQPGLDVLMFLNGAMLDRQVVSESGTFTFDNIPLVEGENTVYAYATTTTELQSEQSKSYVIILDTAKPTVTINSPKEGEVYRGTSSRIANFSGSVSEARSKVYIGERMAIVSSDGTFTLPYQLVEGDQEIPIKVIDEAGNENTSMIKLRWEP